MRKTLLATILAITVFDLMPLSHKMASRVSANKANPFPAQGLGSVSINDASVTEGNTGTINIDLGQTVTLQIRNADGTLSNEFSFTRPAS